MSDRSSRLQLLEDPDFKAMSAARNRIALSLTAVTLLIYYGFIFLLAFNKDFFGKKISEGSNITVGMPLGVGVIVASWVLTGIYVRWANQRYDPMILAIRSKAENGNGPDRPGPG